YRLSMHPTFCQKKKVITSLLWRCCPGHGGPNCEDEGDVPFTGVFLPAGAQKALRTGSGRIRQTKIDLWPLESEDNKANRAHLHMVQSAPTTPLIVEASLELHQLEQKEHKDRNRRTKADISPAGGSVY
ncbi:hypothetical protein GOODEAATRI_007069, partial [Goodea atripinnis]